MRQNKCPHSVRGQASAQLQKGETFPKGKGRPPALLHPAANPISHSAHGPGGGAQLERPLRAKKYFLASHALFVTPWQRARPKKNTPQAPPHTAHVALGVGRSSRGHCKLRNNLWPLPRSLSPPGRGQCLALGPNSQDQKRPQKKTQASPHTARVALGAGRSSSGHCEPKNVFAASPRSLSGPLPGG